MLLIYFHVYSKAEEVYSALSAWILTLFFFASKLVRAALGKDLGSTCGLTEYNDFLLE